MKNTIFFLLVSFFAFSYTTMQAQARTYSTTQTDDDSYTFETTFSALILKPGSSNMHYAAEAIPEPLPSPNWNIFDLNPGYHFGFDLGFTFINLCDCFCVMLDWQHLKASKCNRVSVGSENMVGPFFEIGPDASPYKISCGNVKFSFNQVNLDIGHYIEFDDCFHATIFTGVGVARIKEELHSAYSNTDGTITRNIITPVTFTGAGPQFGIDFSYNVWKHVHLTGNGLFSLFSGKSKNNTLYCSFAPELQAVGVTPPNQQRTCVGRRSQLVPAFQEKIGLAFNFVWHDCFSVQIEAGFQSQIYLSALQSVDIGSEVVTPPVTPDTVGVFARTFQRNISNFSLAGPYVTLDIKF